MAIRAAIDRFLRVEHNKPFSIYESLVLSEANLVLDSFVKDLGKTGKIGGIVHVSIYHWIVHKKIYH